jgi:hypothetical protein
MNCEQCRIGQLRLNSAPYLRWIDEQIMVIPDSPAYACDVCDNMVYDINFLNKLQMLLDQLAGDGQIGEPAIRPMMPEEIVNWQSSRRST